MYVSLLAPSGESFQLRVLANWGAGGLGRCWGVVGVWCFSTLFFVVWTGGIAWRLRGEGIDCSWVPATHTLLWVAHQGTAAALLHIISTPSQCWVCMPAAHRRRVCGWHVVFEAQPSQVSYLPHQWAQQTWWFIGTGC